MSITVTPHGRAPAAGRHVNAGASGRPDGNVRDEIEADRPPIMVGGRSALFVDFKGKDKQTSNDKRIVGAICETGGRTWFFKMTGQIDAVGKQKPAFDQFLASVRFGGRDEQ